MSKTAKSKNNLIRCTRNKKKVYKNRMTFKGCMINCRLSMNNLKKKIKNYLKTTLKVQILYKSFKEKFQMNKS